MGIKKLPFKDLSIRKMTCYCSSFSAVTFVFAAGPHHGDWAGGSKRSEGQGHRGVCSRPAVLQGTCSKGAVTHICIYLDMSYLKTRCCCTVAHKAFSQREYFSLMDAHISSPILGSVIHWFFLGAEGPVVICTGGRGDQMGDHRPRCVETACQTVHERGCIPGRSTQTHIDTYWQINKCMD